MSTAEKVKLGADARRLYQIEGRSDFVEWLGDRPLSEVWPTCPNGNWMVRLLGRQSGPADSASRKKLVLIACECARLALPHSAPDDTPLEAIETAERWARGEAGVSLDDVRLAGLDAKAEALSAGLRSTWAWVASAAEWAAATAASPKAAEWVAEAWWAKKFDRNKALAQCADIVRKHCPDAPSLDAA